MKSLLWLFPIALFMAAPPAFSQSKRLIYDGFNTIAGMERRVRDVKEVNRTPLFDNAPFLRLRKGDKLVQAKEVFPAFNKPVAQPDRINYYLFSGGRYFQLWTQ